MGTSDSTVPAVLSIDLEYFSHTPAYRTATGTTNDSAIGREAIPTILDALAETDSTATFFTVSEIIEETPGVVETIADAGHEIGSHTHTHQHLSERSAAQRQAELATSRRRLESVTDQSVVGFRAPSFDITEDHFELLEATGYEYDSSVVPCRSIPGWYGGEYDETRPVSAAEIHPTAPATLTELPVAVMPGVGLPLTGTWIRFFGVRYTILGMRLLARRGIPPVLYIHPWELADLPRVEGVPARVYVRTGAYMRRALRRILAEPYEFVAANTVVGDRVLYGRG